MLLSWSKQRREYFSFTWGLPLVPMMPKFGHSFEFVAQLIEYQILLLNSSFGLRHSNKNSLLFAELHTYLSVVSLTDRIKYCIKVFKSCFKAWGLLIKLHQHSKPFANLYIFSTYCRCNIGVAVWFSNLNSTSCPPCSPPINKNFLSAFAN